MKTIEQLPTINDDAELTLNLGEGMSHFVITGPAESLEPMAQDAMKHDEGLQARAETRTHKLAARMVKATQTALEAPTELIGRRATIAAKIYDIRHGRNMYDLLKQKRDDERDLQMATKLGLMSVEDVSCRKHRKAIAKLHGLVDET